jgi:cobalamin biosynthesis Mg chelatase CobN
MKTIQIKGKDYVTVNERIKFIADNFQYSVDSNYEYFPEQKMWVVKATLSLIKDGVTYTYVGLAQEVESSNYKDVNHTSALENAQTSAIGRCAAFAAIGIDGGIASADEVQKAINRTDEVGEDSRLYLLSLLENTTYDEQAKEKLAMRIEGILKQDDYIKALSNLQMNQIEDKDRISMGLPYNQSDIKKTLKNLK